MSKRNNWYLPNLKTHEPMGPFSYEQIYLGLKKGKITPDDFIWSPDLEREEWMKINEVDDFQEFIQSMPKIQLPKIPKAKPKVKKIEIDYSGNQDLARKNEYRRYPRAPLQTEAIIHNNEFFKKVIIEDISEKGVFIKSDTDLFEQGSNIVFTLLRHDILGTFSIHSVLINKRDIKGQFGYGLYFLHIGPQLRKKIAEYVVATLNQYVEEAKVA
jgi:hypothetical protein